MPVTIAGLVALSPYNLMIPPILVFAVAICISGAATFLFALPLVLWLRRTQHLNAALLCILGGVVGAVVYGAFMFYNGYYPEITDRTFALHMAAKNALSSMLPGGIFGLLSAAALCVGAGITIRPSRRRTGAA